MNNNRHEYLDTVKTRIDGWNVDIEKLVGKTDSATPELKVAHQQGIDALKVQRTEFEKKVSEVRAASDTAWEGMKVGLETAATSMGDAVKSAVAKLS